MQIVDRTKNLLRNLFRSKHVESDLDAELRSYADLLTDENRAQGLAPDEARRKARIELGGIEQVKENVRDIRAVNAVLLKPLPIRQPNRVVALHDQLFDFGMPRAKVSPLQFREYSERTEIFESTAAFKAFNLTLTSTDQALHLQA